MTAPLRGLDPPPPGSPERPRLTRRMRARLLWRVLRGRLASPARMLPGLAAAGCAFAGSWLLWNLGTALLVAVPFLLAVDARTPRA